MFQQIPQLGKAPGRILKCRRKQPSHRLIKDHRRDHHEDKSQQEIRD